LHHNRYPAIVAINLCSQ